MADKDADLSRVLVPFPRSLNHIQNGRWLLAQLKVWA
jgi:hypothetical protein